MKSRAGIIFNHCLLVFLIVVLTVFSSGITVKQASADTVKCETCDTGGQTFGHTDPSLRRHGLIRYTPQQIEAENRLLETAPLVKIEPTAGVKALSDGYTEGGTRNLLSSLSYDPTQRDQGNGCGSCWVWAGTGCLEVALNAQRGIKDRLSVQYFTSTYNGGRYPWACCGGDATTFANHYDNTLKKAISWSNTNAAYVDGSRTCYGSTAMPAGSISTTPNYPISSVTAYRIPTYSTDGVNQATAIANIKNVLDQNKAIYFGFSMANDADWDQFIDFWYDRSESDIWRGGYSCGDTWTSGGGGHGVLCVGYDDTPEGTANDYWVMLNSWGAPGNRTNGLFRVPMYYNYDCSISGYSYSTRWWTIEPVFTAVVPAAPTLISPANGAAVSGTAITFTWDVVAGATNYHIRVGTDAAVEASLFRSHYTYGATSRTYTDFPASGTTFYWKVRAYNASGWGPWSAIRSFTNSSSLPEGLSLSSPADGATVSGTTITFAWGAVSGATNYHIRVGTDAAVETNIFRSHYTYGATAKSYTGFPNDGTVYYWKVRAYNAYGWGPWSAICSFTNSSGLPAAPSLSSPADVATVPDTSITFTWDTASGATNYHIRVGTDASVETSLFRSHYTYGATSKTYTGFSNDGTIYYWKVRAYNTYGWGPWSTIRSIVNGP